MPKQLDHTAACEHLSRVDRRLAKIIAKSGPCRWQPETMQNIFEALLESIIYQQLNGKVAATITQRVKALFPENTKRIRTRRGLVDGFPTPEQVLAAPEALLRSAGLSQAKMLAIRDLAAKTVDGTVPTLKQATRMSDEELIERIDAVRGIGRWTVEMLLIFRLGRQDVLPVDDYGVRKGFAKMRKLSGTAQAEGAHGLRGALAPLSQCRELVLVARSRDERSANGGSGSRKESGFRKGRSRQRGRKTGRQAWAWTGSEGVVKAVVAQAGQGRRCCLGWLLQEKCQKLIGRFGPQASDRCRNKRWHLVWTGLHCRANIHGFAKLGLHFGICGRVLRRIQDHHFRSRVLIDVVSQKAFVIRHVEAFHPDRRAGRGMRVSLLELQNTMVELVPIGRAEIAEDANRNRFRFGL